jgi:hypothetical protein
MGEHVPRGRPELPPAASAEPAQWIPTRVHGFARSVLSLVPDGFPCYVRLFHPCLIAGPAGPRQVRWREVAAANRKTVHAGTQFTTVVRDATAGRDPDHLRGLYDVPPVIGTLPESTTATLAATLAAHTTTTDECWFGRWEGYGPMFAADEVVPTLSLPYRRYHLFTASLAALTADDAPGIWQSPNLWWPRDRSWFVATEVDLDSTYLAVSSECAADLLTNDELEVLAIDPTTGVDVDSDTAGWA